jgi:hypothetical protein
VLAPVPVEFWALLAATGLWLAADRRRRLQGWLSEPGGMFGVIKVSSALAAAFLVLELFSRTDIAVPFIYFRF